jgi:hypothetical protein
LVGTRTCSANTINALNLCAFSSKNKSLFQLVIIFSEKKKKKKLQILFFLKITNLGIQHKKISRRRYDQNNRLKFGKKK